MHLALAAFLLLVPLTAAAGAAPPARFAGCEPTIDGAPVRVAKLRLAGATRDAFAADPSRTVIAACGGEAGVLVFSTGVRGAAAPGPVELVVEIENEEADGWSPLWSGATAGDAWVDHRVELPRGPAPRRLRLRAVAASGAAAGEAFWGSLRFLPARADGAAPLNVVLVSLDTLGARYLGAYGGHAAASRNIDAFLRRSFAFDRAYATYPNTLVSHASLLSGLYPSSHGVYGSLRNSRVGVELLSTVLGEHGYFNVAFTENAFVSSDFGFDEGFDWYDDGPERGESSFLGDARETFGRARRWLERHGADAPFLLFVHTYEVHSPYVARDDDSRRIADGVFAGAASASSAALGESVADVEHLHNAGLQRLSPDEIRRLEALHVGELHYLDRQFADLMASLERMPFAGRTLVVVFADHGDEFDPHGVIGHGESLHDVVMHVPLAFHLPGRIAPGAYDRPVSLVDVAPTVLDLLGWPNALAADGRSLRPLLDGATAELPSRPVFTELLKAAGSCLKQDLPEDCFVGRFGVYGDDWRYEYSSLPYYENLSGAGAGDERAAEVQALLAAYVTGRPWQTKVPWQPRAVATGDGDRQEIDEATRQRLEALGYDF